MVRIPSHSTVCLIGSPLEQGCSLIFFWIGNKNTCERDKNLLGFPTDAPCLVLGVSDISDFDIFCNVSCNRIKKAKGRG